MTAARTGCSIALALVAAGLASCSAPSARTPAQPVLEDELASIADANAAGEFIRALDEAERVLARADRSTPQGAWARFSAALLAGEAHARLAASAPYLREPTAAGGLAPSSNAHRMAMARYFALARATAARTQLEQPAAEVRDALEGANLLELAFHAELGLEASCRAYLQRTPQLHDARAALELLQRLPLAGRRPWIYGELFEFQRARDERQAYRFAVLAIDEAPSASGFDAQRVARLERWITHESTLEFHCPRCDLAVNPGLRACPNDRTPNVEFDGRRRL